MATKDDLEAAKRKEQIKEVERKGKLAALNDYVGFTASKLGGLTGVGMGGLEIIDPNIIAAVIPSPEIALGAGLALLAGKGVLTVIAKAAQVFGGKP